MGEVSRHELARLRDDPLDVYVFDLPEAERMVELWEGGGELRARLAASYAATAIDTKDALSEIGSFIAKTFRSARIEYCVRTYTARTVLVIRAGSALREVIAHSVTALSVKPKTVRFAFARTDPAYALGKARSALKAGGVLTIVLITGVNVLDHLIRDDSTWQRLASRVAADIATIGASIAVSALAVSLAPGIIAGFAFGPLGVAIAAGLVANLLLEEFDVSSRLARTLEARLDEVVSEQMEQYARLKGEWEWWHANPIRALEFWQRVFGVPY